MIISGKITLPNRRIFTQMCSDVFCDKCQCHDIEFKTVDKHLIDEQDSRYSEIRVKVVEKGVTKGELNGNDTGML